MNQQIKLLAQEAGMYVDVKGEPWPRWMGAEECEAAYEKFAELIVRQCALLCPDPVVVLQHWGLDSDAE
jgi:hypothetical protein